MASSKINDGGTEPYQCELVRRSNFTCTKCILRTLSVIITNCDNSYKDSLTMARVVCQNMLENRQCVKETFSAFKVGSTN